jgi:hypothetical protein
MAQYKSISQWTKRLEKDIESSKKQAISRALISARAEYSKSVGAETGLSATKLKKRTRIEKATNTLSIGIRRLFFAHDFTVKAVKVISRLGKRLGAQYKTKTEGYTLLPGSFVAKGKNSNKKIVLHRTGAERYPITGTVVDVFTKAVQNNVSNIKKAMADSFKKNFTSKLKFNRDKQ